MKPLLLLILFLLLSSRTTLAQVHINNLDSYSLNKNIYLLKEQPNNFLSVKEALQLYDKHQFAHFSNTDNNLNLGFVDQFYWIAIPLKKFY